MRRSWSKDNAGLSAWAQMDDNVAMPALVATQVAANDPPGDLILKSSPSTQSLNGGQVFVDRMHQVPSANVDGPVSGHGEETGGVSQPLTFDGDRSSTGSLPSALKAAPAITVGDGATTQIEGASAQSVTFTGTAGTVILDDAVAFTGQVSGLTGSDTLDLADVSYGSNTTATFSGNASGGTLTVTNGTETANIALVGDYLNSGWTLSNDGHGGTLVVDPPLAGSVYPNATNTGIQAGTTLTPATSNTITEPGVYSGLIFIGQVNIDCSNVTLENCLIEALPSDWASIVVSGGDTGYAPVTNVVIQNCEIEGAGVNSTQDNAYGIEVPSDSQVSILNNNIHDVGSPFAIGGGQVTIENNYVHDFNSGSGTHYDGMQYNGGGSSDFSLTMENNAIINNQSQTDAIMIDRSVGSGQQHHYY